MEEKAKININKHPSTKVLVEGCFIEYQQIAINFLLNIQEIEFLMFAYFSNSRFFCLKFEIIMMIAITPIITKTDQ